MKHTHFYLLIAFSLCSIASAAEPFHFAETDQKQLTLTEGGMPILTYQFDVIEHENVPPRDRRRTAGCYVHPLHGLNGEILTDNAPADHYHHHGVFWTWPHVGVHEPDGSTRHYDLWTSNTALKQHFVRWIDRTISDESATFAVENGWFVGNPQDGIKIMTERVKIIVHRIQTVGNVRSRAVDFEFQWQPTDRPVTLRGSAGKSYGGFTVRFRPVIPDGKTLAEPSEMNKITVPSGITPGDLEEMPLAWAGYTSAFGSLDGEKRLSGAVIFVSPTHPNFPPTWLTRYYGPLCVGWPGVDGRTFQPGEKIELRYRIWIHDGAVTLPQIERAYGEYVGENR